MSYDESPVSRFFLPLALLAVGFAAGASWHLAPREGELPSASAPASPTVVAHGDLAADEKATIQIFRETSPSVVYITSLVVRRDFLELLVADAAIFIAHAIFGCADLENDIGAAFKVIRR